MAFMIVFNQESEPEAMGVGIVIMRRRMQFRPLNIRAKAEYVWA